MKLIFMLVTACVLLPAHQTAAQTQPIGSQTIVSVGVTDISSGNTLADTSFVELMPMQYHLEKMEVITTAKNTTEYALMKIESVRQELAKTSDATRKVQLSETLQKMEMEAFGFVENQLVPQTTPVILR